MIQGLKSSGEDWRVMLLPDHATPIAVKTHTMDPVPFAIMGSGIKPDGVQSFDEGAAKRGGFGVIDATELMGFWVKGNG